MTHDPRLALEELVAAFRAHFELAQSDVDTDSEEFLDAEEHLSNAFFTYDDVLFRKLEVELPFEILDDEDEEEGDDDFDDDDFEDIDEDDLDDDLEDDDFDDDEDDFVDIDD